MTAVARLLVCAAWMLGPGASGVTVAAPAVIVAVTAAPAADVLIVEALNRLRAELALAGMRAVPAAPGTNPEKTPGGGAPADATVTLSRATSLAGATATAAEAPGPGIVVQVVVAVPRTGGALSREAYVSVADGADDASVLAIRAVELLRATLMQARMSIAAPAPNAGPPARDPGSSARASRPVVVPASRPPRWDVALGAALLQSVAGFGSAFGPTARVALRLSASFGVEVQAAGPLFARDLSAEAGSASVRQELASASASWVFRRARGLSPVASLGIGLYHVQVVGDARTGQAVSSALWAPLASAGAGLLMAVGRRWTVRVDAAALFVHPAPYVQIGPTDAGHAGRPLLLVSFTVGRGSPRTSIP